jgi:proline iminopeptidase
MNEYQLPVNGAELRVAEQGNGPPLLLCPGGPGLCDYLGPVADMIDDLVRVYRFDPRGCGQSSATPPYDVATLITDLEAIRDALGHERWLVGGHSFGADIALAYALEHPDRVRGVLHLSGTGIQDDRQWHAAYEAGRATGIDPEPTFAYPVNLEVNRQVIASWRRYVKRATLLRGISELPVPIVAICGCKDPRPNWPVEQLVELLPQARLILLQGAGHCPWLTHPAELESVLRTSVQDIR